ncbi:MAG TPA: hypothetical protein VFS41_04520 [Edaphobacter sp.]|nr:hypothetical protein [Edaphobacter sp.]
MRIVSWLAAFMAATILCGPAQAAQESPCETPQAWVARVESENPNIRTAKVEKLPDNLVPALVKHYNEMPPVDQQTAADAAVIIIGTGNGQVSPALVGLFLKGCRVGSFPMTVPAQDDA